MSRDYGVFCLDCKTGYLTDQHDKCTLVALVMEKSEIAAVVQSVRNLNTMPWLNFSLACEDLYQHDSEHVLSFLTTHHTHNLQVLDEYEFHDLGWVGNAHV